MNKKQLQESIMTGVKKAFANNKSLNEGFSAWKEQNVPKINQELFNKCIDNISEVFAKLMQMKQVTGMGVVFHDEKSGSWKSFCQFTVNSNVTSLLIKDSINQAISEFKKQVNDEDLFVNLMSELYLKIIIPKNSHLFKYITSTIDPGSNKIKNMPYISLVKPDVDAIGFRFSFKSLLDNCAEILEYLS